MRLNINIAQCGNAPCVPIQTSWTGSDCQLFVNVSSQAFYLQTVCLTMCAKEKAQMCVWIPKVSECMFYHSATERNGNGGAPATMSPQQQRFFKWCRGNLHLRSGNHINNAYVHKYNCNEYCYRYMCAECIRHNIGIWEVKPDVTWDLSKWNSTQIVSLARLPWSLLIPLDHTP